jgi:prophage regulatory protein
MSQIFDELPSGALLRASQLVQSPQNLHGGLPFSKPTLWRKVREGTFPQPIKLSAGVTAWKVADVRCWLVSQSNANPTPTTQK